MFHAGGRRQGTFFRSQTTKSEGQAELSRFDCLKYSARKEKQRVRWQWQGPLLSYNDLLPLSVPPGSATRFATAFILVMLDLVPLFLRSTVAPLDVMCLMLWEEQVAQLSWILASSRTGGQHHGNSSPSSSTFSSTTSTFGCTLTGAVAQTRSMDAHNLTRLAPLLAPPPAQSSMVIHFLNTKACGRGQDSEVEGHGDQFPVR